MGCTSRALAPFVAAMTIGVLPVWAALPAPQEWASGSSLPGARLSFEERGLSESEDGELLMSYVIAASGLPADRLYELWMRRLDGSTSADPLLVRVGEQGALVTDGNGSDVEVAFMGMMAGEPVAFLLRSDDGPSRVVQSFIPLPLAATGGGGCKVSLEMSLTDATAYLAHVTEFDPGEEIRVESRSGQEVLEYPLEVPEDETKSVLFLLPEVSGLDGGWASLTLSGRSCSVSIDYPWGTAAKPL